MNKNMTNRKKPKIINCIPCLKKTIQCSGDSTVQIFTLRMRLTRSSEDPRAIAHRCNQAWSAQCHCHKISWDWCSSSPAACSCPHIPNCQSCAVISNAITQSQINKQTNKQITLKMHKKQHQHKPKQRSTKTSINENDRSNSPVLGNANGIVQNMRWKHTHRLKFVEPDCPSRRYVSGHLVRFHHGVLQPLRCFGLNRLSWACSLRACVRV
jgi:type IV secretory pathway VirB4 component